MEQGPSLAAMLRGAGAMGNPQDVKRATMKRAAKGTPGNAGVPDGGDAAFGPAGLPPHSGASGLGAQLAAVPVTRNTPSGGTGAGDPRSFIWPDADPAKRPRRARRAPYRSRKPSFDQSPYRRA